MRKSRAKSSIRSRTAESIASVRQGCAAESRGRTRSRNGGPTGPSAFFELTSAAMAEMLACLHHGKVEVLGTDQAAQELASPYLEQLATDGGGHGDPRIVSVTRGRTSGELCYAISSGSGSNVLVQVAGTGREQQLFQPATHASRRASTTCCFPARRDRGESSVTWKKAEAKAKAVLQ